LWQYAKSQTPQRGDRRHPMAEPLDQPRSLVGETPHSEVSDREDRLVEHQDGDDRTGGDTGGHGEPL